MKPDSIAYLPITENSWFWGPSVTSVPPFVGGTIGPEDKAKTIAFTNSNAIIQASTNYTINVDYENRKASAETLTLAKPTNVTFEYIEEIFTYYGYDFNNEVIRYNYVNSDPGLYYRIVIKVSNKYLVFDFNQNPPTLVNCVSSFQYTYTDYEKSDIPDEVISATINIPIVVCDFIASCVIIEPSDSIEIQLALQVIYSNLIKHIDQLEFQQEVEFNPFLEPAPANQNVDGGIGIFSSMSNSDWRTLTIPCQ